MLLWTLLLTKILEIGGTRTESIPAFHCLVEFDVKYIGEKLREQKGVVHKRVTSTKKLWVFFPIESIGIRDTALTDWLLRNANLFNFDVGKLI